MTFCTMKQSEKRGKYLMTRFPYHASALDSRSEREKDACVPPLSPFGLSCDAVATIGLFAYVGAYVRLDAYTIRTFEQVYTILYRSIEKARRELTRKSKAFTTFEG